MARRFALYLFPLFCLALLASASPAFAQSLGVLELETMQPPVVGQDAAQDAPGSADDDMQIIHVTDRLARMPESVAALQAYHEAKALGLLPAAKTFVSYDVGDERKFNVVTNIATDTPRWKELAFTLTAENDVANIWVANDQQGVASDEELAKLQSYMLSETPGGSWRPEEGAIANSNYIFGDPPIPPGGDSKIHILLFDIEEGGDCCVLGYVTALDLDPDPASGAGNMANILYVDLPQGLSAGVDQLAGTATHEYQHLIHNAYQTLNFTSVCSTCELVFVNEGLSEWSELLHGFPPRFIRYLSDPHEHGVRLFSWRRRTVRVLYDYQRAGLFTTYIADRIGREATGSIVQAKCPSGADFCSAGSWLNGAAGYDLALRAHGFSLRDMVADFHAANFINDAVAGAQYAYKSPSRKDLRTPSTRLVDVEEDPAPSEATVNVSSGAVEYLTWENATDLALEIRDFGDTDGGPGEGGPGEGEPGEGGPGEGGPPVFRTGTVAGASNRAHLSLRLFTETEAGAKKVVELDPDTESYAAPGKYERVTLIVANTFVSESATAPSVKLDIIGNWGGGSFEATTAAYENARNEDQIYLSGGKDEIMAQAYPVPDRARLTSVFVAPVYENQYSNGEAPAGAPRDFTLKVWDAQWRNVPYEFDDSTDPPTPVKSWRIAFPGRELYSQDVDESPSASHIFFNSGAYSFLRVDLPTDEPALAALPDSIFIGLANKGQDNNYLSLAMARSKQGAREDTLAYWYGELRNRDGELVKGWRPMAILRLCQKETGDCDPEDDEDGWFSLAGQVFPIRARFRISQEVTSAEAPPELPSGVTLAQNYPNPFNPTTSISWTQPASAAVRLSVYNLLGQRVAVLVDGARPPGEHEVRLDASGWPSGVYVYVLEAGERVAARRMALLK